MRIGRCGARRAGGGGAAGYTLLELLLVISIAATVIGMAAPRFKSSYERLHFEEAVRRTQTFLWAARWEAIRREQPVEMDLADGGPALEWGGEEADGEAAATHALAFADVELAGESLPIVFRPDGSASGGAIILLAGARAETLLVDGPTGLIYLPREAVPFADELEPPADQDI